MLIYCEIKLMYAFSFNIQFLLRCLLYLVKITEGIYVFFKIALRIYYLFQIIDLIPLLLPTTSFFGQ